MKINFYANPEFIRNRISHGKIIFRIENLGWFGVFINGKTGKIEKQAYEWGKFNFENLTGFEQKCFCKDENDLNYNRRIKLLKLSSLKDEFEHISRKYDISVSLVQSFYTSQQCPKCGCIDSENRKTQ